MKLETLRNNVLWVVSIAAIAISLYTLTSVGPKNPSDVEQNAQTLPRPPADIPIPPPGTFAIRWLLLDTAPPPIPGIRSGSGVSPQSTYFQVDYAGPKKYLELYIDNSLNGEPHSQEVIHREMFGATDMKRKANSISFFEAAPHSRPRQFFVIRAYYIDVPEDPGNMLFSVFSFDAEKQDFWNADQSTAYAIYFDETLNLTGSYGCREGWMDFQSNRQAGGFAGPTNPLSDTEPVELLRFRRDKAESTLMLRFVD